MVKVIRLLITAVVLVAFCMGSAALAAEFFVVKDAAGKVSIVDQKPADAKSIVKGPFATKDEAEKSLKAESAAKKPAKLPDQGC